MVIKVGDFGLSVSTGAKDYYRLTDMGIKLPVMWMAPESLSDYIFSEKSDVVRITLGLLIGDTVVASTYNSVCMRTKKLAYCMEVNLCHSVVSIY